MFSGKLLYTVILLSSAVLGASLHAQAPAQGTALADTVTLNQSVVSAVVPPVVVRGDTVVYNAAAIRVAEDATLGELLSKIPGLEINGSTVTLHGKEIKHVLVDGKKYFGGDIRAGLENIAADMVAGVKAYEQESDLARLSGVDDGEEAPVLDVSIRRSLIDNWRNRVSAGAGTHGRAQLRANATKVSGEQQISVVAGANNAADNSSSSGTVSSNVLGQGSRGDALHSTAGVNFARNDKVREITASLLWNDTRRDAVSKTQGQTILASGSNFSNGRNDVQERRDGIKAELEYVHRFGNALTLLISPTLNYNVSNVFNNAVSSQFGQDLYAYADGGYDPSRWLTGDDLEGDPFHEIRLNSTANLSQNITERINAGITLQAVKRMSKRGRSVSARVYIGYVGSDEDRAYDYSTRYYKIKRNPDSLRMRKQYLNHLTPSMRYSAMLSFNEPLARRLYLQGSYQLNYNHTLSERHFYSLQGLWPEWTLAQGLGREGLEQSLPAAYKTALDPLLSHSASQDYLSQRIMLSLKYSSRALLLTCGIQLTPQHTILHFEDQGETQSIHRSITNAAPFVTVKLKKSKYNQLTLTYRSSGSNPSMRQLMPTPDGTNSTSIFTGNPKLKPSFTQTISLNWNRSDRHRGESFTVVLQYRSTRNAVSNLTVYDTESGVRTISPRNIDGNWFTTGSTVYNKSFRDGRLSLSNRLDGEYRNSMSYLYNNSLKQSEVNRILRSMIREEARLTWRGERLELILGALADRTWERSRLRVEMNQSPWTAVSSLSADLDAGAGLRLMTRLDACARGGYGYDALNRKYLGWNARISQSFLRGKLLLRLDWYDILHDTDNIVRSFNAERRSIAVFNGVNSYVMLRAVYTLGA